MFFLKSCQKVTLQEKIHKQHFKEDKLQSNKE